MTLIALSARAATSQEAVYKNAERPIPDRVHDLLSRMTIEEKVALLESGWTVPSVGGSKSRSLFENGQIREDMARKLAANGLGTYAFLDEFTGTTGSSDTRLGPHRRNLLQSWVLRNTRSPANVCIGHLPPVGRGSSESIDKERCPKANRYRSSKRKPTEQERLVRTCWLDTRDRCHLQMRT